MPKQRLVRQGKGWQREKEGKGYDFPDKQETMAWMSFDADILLSDFFVMTIINGRNKKSQRGRQYLLIMIVTKKSKRLVMPTMPTMLEDFRSQINVFRTSPAPPLQRDIVGEVWSNNSQLSGGKLEPQPELSRTRTIWLR